MGMDLTFNRTKAIAAGLVFSKDTNGSEASIAAAVQRLKDGEEDPAYVHWLRSKINMVAVPGTELMVQDIGVNDTVYVRASKRGHVYRPLTEWLQSNNIEWDEF